MTRATVQSAAAILAAVLTLTACATAPVGITPRSPREAYERRTRSALTSNEPSDQTLNLLRRLELLATYRQDPARATAELHEKAKAEGFPAPELFALAELSFLLGEKAHDRARYAASAIYAYAFLLPEDGRPPLNPLDPRDRLAADLYNRSLVQAMPRTLDGRVDLAAQPLRDLPLGTLETERPPKMLQIRGYQLYDLLPVSELEIHGLKNRYIYSGLGAPFAAKARPLPGASEVIPLSTSARVPVTFVFTIEKPIADLRAGAIHARAHLIQTLEQRYIQVDHRRLRVESEPSAALAAALVESAFWKRELSTFLGGVVGVRRRGALFGLRPYKDGRIPAVFVHGTASSPARWANMVNDLLSDPRLSDRYAFWFFTYDSGNPIAYSAYQLRSALSAAVERADPSGKDPCARDAIVLGHSQGGLLTKLTVIDSGDTFWRGISSKPFDEVKLPEADRKTLEQILFVKPLPFVHTVIFLATPHRGSYLAGPQIVRRLAGRLVRLPSDVVRMGTDVMRLSASGTQGLTTLQVPTSIDNMSPGNRFIQALAKMPVAPGVDAHSIISVEDPNEPLSTAGDGVVKYESAHVEGVASEKIVKSPHSGMQDAAATIEEVRRIFLEHLAESNCPVPKGD